MNIDVYVTPVGLVDKDIRGKTVIVIDVLRASTTICAALSNGCKEVIPVNSVEQAIQLSSDLFQETTLVCGERGGVKVRGFNLGNSPFEFTPEVVAGKTVVLTTTNGTEALLKSRNSDKVFIAAYVNISNIVHALRDCETGIAIVCAGQENRFSLEDFVCAGMLVHGCRDTRNSAEIHLSDTATVAEITYRHYADDLIGMIRTSTHGRILAALGFEADLEFCGKVDGVPVTPIYREGRIINSLDTV